MAIATLVSKIFGLLRQQGIAAAFAVGPVADAYSFAYVIPGFLLVLLGGINGPFHSAIVSVVAKRKREEIAPLVETITTLIGAALLVVTVLIVLFAGPLIDLLARGLSETAVGLEARAIALQQLRIMAPMAFFAGLIGIGFGTLNAADQYWLPSISPLFSSLTVLIGLAVLALSLGSDITADRYALLGGSVLAVGTLAGAVLQWLVQVPALWRSGLGTLKLRFNIQEPGVGDVLKILAPATFSSGMMQINVYTDLYFASYLPQTAAALGYANLLVQTPLGIISNVILVPFLPIFARLSAPENWPELKDRIRQGLLFTALTMLPLSALMITLALPMVRVVYERGAFDQDASEIVTSLLIAYGIGMFVYLGRDVLVRVFYALGDGETPFRISILIFFECSAGLSAGYPTGGTRSGAGNGWGEHFSMLLLLVLLDRRLNGLPWLEWARPIGGLTLCSAIASMICWATRSGLESWLGTEGVWVQLVQLAIAGSLGLGSFLVGTMLLRIPEAALLANRLKQR
ncbi:MAG: murein biosynthesis integral membrane protein MurJ [Leptolyngbyaceae cyanobacterium SM1_1_3]|nr:murein biosynthesis integral membrane protein MurJ [Leptolyngbyaceae cyanobacterium SM1_1_3]